MKLKVFLFVFALTFFLGACQKKPSIAPSLDPHSNIAPPPMGAEVYNDEFKRELNLLEKILGGQADQRLMAHVKNQLIQGKMAKKISKNRGDEFYLSNVFLLLPELIHSEKKFSDQEKKWIKAKFYFLRRRFIESSILLAEILQKDPKFDLARNWWARTIFFLGNPDKAVSELKKIIDRPNQKLETKLDALYLTGAIIFESEDREKFRIEKGIHAWQEFLRLKKPDPFTKKEVETSIQELKARLNNQTHEAIAEKLNPFNQHKGYSVEKNAVMHAFNQEELLLAEKLCDLELNKKHDDDLAAIKARIMIKSGRFDEAKVQLEKIIKKNKNYAPAFHYLGMVFMMQGKPQDAARSWQKTIAIDPAYGKLNRLEQRTKVALDMLEPKKVESH